MEKLLYILVLTFLYVDVVYTRCGCHRVPGQGFLTNRDNMVNHDFEALPQDIQGGSSGASNNQHYSVPNFRVLLFQPTFLDFQEQHVGMPFVQSIVLSNPSDQNDIEITAVNTLPPFHASKFSKKVLKPLTNITVDLVFLATMVGNIEHTIYLHTSRGNFPYQVFAVGTPNPYRLRAFISAKLPVNGTFSPYINMYNPYSESLQITEMYSSGNDLHLDLLGSSINGTISKHWEIAPYETKAIMRAIYYSKEEGIANRFVRIVLGPPASPSDIVIVPFEMTISSKPGLYTNIDMLDFGTLRTMDEPKSLNLNTINIGNKSLQILSIQVIPPNKAVTVRFTPMTLNPSKKYLKIATVTYTAMHVSNKKQNKGKLIVYTSDDKMQLEISYHSNILHGTLAYSVSKTSFYSSNSPTSQELMVTNTFNSTLVIYNATLPKEAKDIFTIVNFSKPILIPPGELISPLSLNFHTRDPQLSLSTVLRLYTNASIFTIPVHCYNGKLEYEVSNVNRKVLDYGTVGVQEQRTLNFRIINNNPVEVSIQKFGTRFEFARLRLLHVKSLKKTKTWKQPKGTVPGKNIAANNTDISNDEDSKIKTENKKDDELILKSSDIATFVVDVIAPPKEGSYHGEILLNTVFETIQIPISMKTVAGALIAKPKKIRITKAFPGRVENYPLSVESTFKYSISLQNLSVFPEDPRFFFIKPDFLPQLLPGEKTHIGWVKFDPFHGDWDQCFLCVCEIDPACDHWYHSLPLPADTWELDFNLLEKLRRKWDLVENKKESSFNASIIIDSSVIKNYIIPVQANLAWPSLVEQSIKFPPTQIGNNSLTEMIITNPSDHPLVVQVVPLLNYPQPDGGLDLLSDRLIVDSFSLDLNGHSLFFLPELKEGKHEHGKVYSMLGVHPSPNTLSMVLEPRQKKSVIIGFTPHDEKAKTSIMVVRNNLTILDLVVMHGQGAKTNFNINGKPPGGKQSILLFEIKAVHLKDCNKSTPKARVYPSFTVKGSFVAANVGQLPVHVASMNINNYECEGYGFRILNCESFILMPNETRKIDITFIPDFTTSRVTRTLRVLTTMGQSLDFTLLATLPHHLLPLCANALPRPYWEPYLHIIAAIVMSAVFIFIIFFAYFDAQKYVVQCTITAGGSTSRSPLGKDLDVYTAGTVFDLNAIAGVKVRITDKKDKSSSESMLHRRVKSAANHPANVTRSHNNSLKHQDTIASSKDRKGSLSDCSTTSTSSRKNSEVNMIPEEKPESKVKEPQETPPKRTKRKTHDIARNVKSNAYQEPQEPKIVIEEISDPWEKQKIGNHEDEKHKKNKRSKASHKKDSTPTAHPGLEKKNSNGSSAGDEYETHTEEKSFGFTTVENNKMKLKKHNSFPSSSHTMDRLDEISLNGPKPDVKEYPKKITKTESTKSNKQQQRPKKTAFQQEKERLMAETQPTSPHAIAAAIFDAALVKKSQQKKKNGKKPSSSKLSRPNSSSSDLSASSRSSSYSNIANEGKERVRSATPSGSVQDSSPSSSGKNSPKLGTYETKEPKGSKKAKKESSGGISSYLKKFIGGREPEATSPTNDNGSSMFFYDNLSSLRASKNTAKNERIESPYENAARNQNDQNFSSTLSPEVPEFVPASQRINKAPGSNLKKDNSWATVDDSALEYLRPPPGLTKQPSRSIWGLDEKAKDRWGRSVPKSSLFDFKNSNSGYSSLLGNTSKPSTTFSSLELLASCGNREDSIWNSESSSIDKDLFGSSSSLRASSIWHLPDQIPGPPPGNLSARSRLNLGLDLKPVGEVSGLGDPESPLDPFSIWASNTDSVSPYEGWNQDIKED